MAKTIEWQKNQAKKRLRRKKRKAKGTKKNMSDAARLYRVVFKHIHRLMPEMLLENQITLAMMITGILRTRSGQLKKIVRTVQYAHKKEVSIHSPQIEAGQICLKWGIWSMVGINLEGTHALE